MDCAMNEYRITKFNPIYRVKGVYSIHEWTNISDIGKTFDTGMLSYAQYEKAEQAHVDCCLALIRKAGIHWLAVHCPEYYEVGIWFPPLVYKEEDIRQIITCCLREKCWVKLETKNFFIHFGYDYHMYVGTELPYVLVEEIVHQYNLFCEVFESPYKTD